MFPGTVGDVVAAQVVQRRVVELVVLGGRTEVPQDRLAAAWQQPEPELPRVVRTS